MLSLARDEMAPFIMSPSEILLGLATDYIARLLPGPARPGGGVGGYLPPPPNVG